VNVFAFILLAAPTLLIVILVFVALIVTGIRRADRRSLRNPSGKRLDAITRRLVGGVRNAPHDDQDR
jgi:hypothetical protein